MFLKGSMLRYVVLTCLLLTALPGVVAQGQSNKEGLPVEVVATASEYVPTTVSHSGHSYTSCQGSTYYFAQVNGYGNSGSVSGTATTDTQCSSTFSPPSEDTKYQRVNYTIAKGGQALYLLSCTQTTGSMSERMEGHGSLMGVLAARSKKCPAFTIGSKYALTIRNTSDARLAETGGGKPSKVEYLSSAALPVPTIEPAPRPQANAMPSQGEAKVHFTSSPSGGEIYVDGKFIGNTPSDIAIAAGEHSVKVTNGGKEWSRSIQITAGEITIHAELGASGAEERTDQAGTVREIAAKDSAVGQMRRIVDAIRQCPEETVSGFFDVAIVHHWSPRVLEWDVLASNSLRAPFQGYIRFDLPFDLHETDEAKRSKELHAKYEFVVKTLSKFTEYRYEFDLGSGAPALRRALFKLPPSSDFMPYEPSANSVGSIFCWDKIANSPGSVAGTTENSPRK